MEIAVHTPHIDAADPSLAAEVEKDLQRFAERLTRVEVFIKDTNAAKGGVDKHCVVEARPRGMDPIAVDHDAESIHDALRGALKKAVHALEHRFGKHDERR